MPIFISTTSTEAADMFGVGPEIGKPHWDFYSGLQDEYSFERASRNMKDVHRMFATSLLGKTFGRDFGIPREDGIYDISSEKLAEIVDSIQVELKDGDKVKKGSYREVYNIPEITGENKDAVMAHLAYNMVSGDLQKGYLDNSAIMYAQKIAPGILADYDVDQYIIKPYMKDVQEAKAAVQKADETPRPTLRLNPVTGLLGKLMNKIGFNFGYGKTYRDYKNSLNEWTQKTALPKERELITREHSAEQNARSIVENSSKSTAFSQKVKEMNAQPKTNAKKYDRRNRYEIQFQDIEENESVKKTDMESLKSKLENKGNIIQEEVNENNNSPKKVSKITLYARKLEKEKKISNVL